MLQFKTGDILAEDADALVNTVNCVGVMGRGVALQFKRKFPENFKAYAALCARHEIVPGRVFVFETGKLVPPRFIINFPTKQHWRGKSRIEYIRAGLDSLVQELQARDIRSVAIPPLGAGLGGLDWNDVRSRVQAALEPLADVQVVVFEPGGGPSGRERDKKTDSVKLTPARSVLVRLLDRYLRVGLDPFVTLLEAHKLMYFMQVAGEPLNLKFSKGHFGPYAGNLRHLLNSIEGHFVSGFADGGEARDKPLWLEPGAAESAQTYLMNQVEVGRRLERVFDLIEGFETSFGLELLATVHWIGTEEDIEYFEDIVRFTYAWNTRKKKFSERQLKLATKRLIEQDWIREGTIFIAP